LFLVFIPAVLQAQEVKSAKKIDYLYDDDLLSKEFHRERREALRALLPDHSVAVFFANPIRNRSNDVDYEYHQDPNFYYLTGFNETDAVLLVFKNRQDLDSVSVNELIFVPEKNPKKERWTGKKLGTQGTENTLDIIAFPNTVFADAAIDF
jgi:Xaa-Pro aminopeptidase